jgi:hypothetical protein
VVIPRVKRQWRGFDDPLRSDAENKEKHPLCTFMAGHMVNIHTAVFSSLLLVRLSWVGVSFSLLATYILPLMREISLPSVQKEGKIAVRAVLFFTFL